MEAVDKLDVTRIQHLIDEAKEQGISLDGATLGFALRKTIKKLSEQLLADPDNIDLMKTLEEATGIARNLPFEVNVWKAQNNFYQLLQKIYPNRLEKARQGDAVSGEWIEHFVLLGQNLAVKVDRAAAPQLQQAS
jgi:hypothetical protein